MRLLKDQDLSNKNVVVRLDLNVPIQDKQIIDSTRIISSVPTIKYLVNKNCKVLLTSHLGRPEEGKFDQEFSMSPVAEKLSEILNHEIDLIDSDIALIPETTVKADLDTSLKVFKLLEMLEDLDDTQNVTSNIEFAEGMLDQLD